MPSIWSDAQRRVVAYAGSTVVIEYHEARGARLIEALFRYAPTLAEAPPSATYRLRWFEDSQRLALYRGDMLIYLGQSEGHLAELLLGETCRRLAEHGRGGVLFHAAALSRGGRGIMLPGAIAAGKSTLTAWLTVNGFGYLTDELVFVAQGRDEMQPLVRPLNLKRPSRAVLQPWVDWSALSPYLLASDESDLIPPERLNPDCDGRPLPLGAILFPHYLPDSPLVLRRLSSAQAGLELLQCLANAPNLPDQGFAEAARLARLAPAYTLTYSCFEQLGECLQGLMTQG